MAIYCTCELARGGYSNPGAPDYEWWVHTGCGKPNRKWLEGQESVLNYFKGGPIDGYAYETERLLAELGIPVDEYVWTPEIIVSPTTGKTARVWQHNTLATGQPLAPTPPIPPPLPEETAVAPQLGDGPSAAVEGDSTMATKKKAAGSLEDRRKAGKFSRAQVAEQADLTAAKVYRIEKGTGKTTEEETAQVSAALDALEAATADPA